MSDLRRIEVVDSHTGGEPTRVVIAGGPLLGDGSVAEKARRFRAEHDHFRSAIVCEPRGSDVLVGALLVEPVDKACAVGVIFFNNVGVLGMCGHGTIGLIVTLAHLGRIGEGTHRIETPVGVVAATLHGDKSVSVTNVPSHRATRSVPVQLATGQLVTGDVAWGGNWFFLCGDHGAELELSRVGELTDLAWAIRRGVNAQGFPEVDHVELLGPPRSPGAAARNFVLCPGGAYDRSPCGTGTSAKLACLAADDELAEGEACVIESILGSSFTARYRWIDRSKGVIEPTITGTAHVNGEAKLLLDERDPFCWGIR
jgi:4-hydroxyproline epimerase